MYSVQLQGYRHIYTTQITQKIHKDYTNSYPGIVIDYHGCHIVALQQCMHAVPEQLCDACWIFEIRDCNLSDVICL